MTGPEHYKEAGRLLAQAESAQYGDDREAYYLRAAQVHATLALAAATAISEGGTMPGADFDAWERVAGTAPKAAV